MHRGLIYWLHPAHLGRMVASKGDLCFRDPAIFETTTSPTGSVELHVTAAIIITATVIIIIIIIITAASEAAAGADLGAGRAALRCACHGAAPWPP